MRLGVLNLFVKMENIDYCVLVVVYRRSLAVSQTLVVFLLGLIFPCKPLFLQHSSLYSLFSTGLFKYSSLRKKSIHTEEVCMQQVFLLEPHSCQIWPSSFWQTLPHSQNTSLGKTAVRERERLGHVQTNILQLRIKLACA